MGRKRRLIVFMVTFLMLMATLTGCVNSTEHTEVVSQLELVEEERDALKEEIQNKDKEISSLTAKQNEISTEVSELKKELDELKNGAPNLLVQIRNHYENKEYTEAIKIAEVLHSKFNGVQEDVDGQEIVKACQSELDKIEAERIAEEERIAQEKLKSAQEKAREIIRVKKVYFDMDSAGGVDVYINFVNNSDKQIKYADFVVTPYNAVGDKVLDHGNYDSTCNLRDTGPFSKGQGNSGSTYWSNSWYNSTTETIKLEEVRIEYMDGEAITLSGEDIKHIQY